MKTKRLALFLSVIAFCFTTSVFAQATKNADPTGTWRWESDQDGATVKHELALTANKKGEVVGVYNGMMDDLKSEKGSIEGNKLTLDFDVDRPEATFEARYVVTIDGDLAEGTLTLSSDEGSMDIPWKANRTVEMSDVVGKWNLLVESDDGDHAPKMIVMKKGDEYAATFEGEGLSGCKVSDMKAKGSDFKFTVAGELQGMSFTANCVTKPRGHNLKGDLVIEVDGNEMEMSFTGKRERQPDLSTLVGTWDLLLEAPDEDHEPKLIVKESDGKVSAIFDAGPMGKFPAQSLELKDGKLHFNMEGELEGQEFEAKCVTKVMGKKLKGAMMLNLSGEEMELSLSGELAK